MPTETTAKAGVKTRTQHSHHETADHYARVIAQTRHIQGRCGLGPSRARLIAGLSARRSDGLVDLARMSARWASDNRLRLVNADPDVPDELNDRAQDNARSLCAIADAAGGEWPKIVRAALIGAAATEIEDEPRSPGVLLLTDIGDIAARWKGITIASSELLEELLADQEGPWAEWRRGNPITARGVARLLKPFGINPQKDRRGRYYRLADFEDALTRYIQEHPE